MPKSDLPTIDEAIESVLKEVNEPVAVSTFIDRVLEIRPSSSKKPATGIRNQIRRHHIGRDLVFLDKETIVPLRVAVPGIRFRIPLSRLEVDRGILILDPSFRGWVTHFDDPEAFEFTDEMDQKLPTRVVSITQKVASILGESNISRNALDLADWFRAHRARGNDSILVTFECWKPKRFRLEIEPAKEHHRHHQEIAKKNQELADILFDMLESSRYEDIGSREAILTAYLRLSDPKGYPGDHWIDVIKQDPRMKLSSLGSITYVEKLNIMESILMDKRSPVAKQKFTSKEGSQVYGFKAAFKHRKGLWRVIEIQGRQTLEDLDDVLREAFGHDSSDHLSGFWKLIRRGQSKRFREIRLGDVEPFGGGSGAHLRIAGLELQVGDKLKYVYDFGDWIEHEIALETIESPQAGVKYPRISGQNKPRYKYCEHCRDEGRKTVATYICIECSNDEQRRVLICEDCLDKYHEDHYTDEIIY